MSEWKYDWESTRAVARTAPGEYAGSACFVLAGRAPQPSSRGDPAIGRRAFRMAHSRQRRTLSAPRLISHLHLHVRTKRRGSGGWRLPVEIGQLARGASTLCSFPARKDPFSRFPLDAGGVPN